MTANFELYKDQNNQFRWRLRHENSKIIADSGESYVDEAGCRNGIESVKKNAPTAQIVSTITH